MIQFELNLASGDDAVVSDPTREIARILHNVANKVEDGAELGTIYDLNGNPIGEWSFDPDDDDDDD